MKEGWLSESDYLVLFDDAEVGGMTKAYGIDCWLPKFTLLGIAGWDDFIVVDDKGQRFRVPTIPVDQSKLEPLRIPLKPDRLEPDQRFSGKIKWYTKPIVFGGDPTSKENMIWIDIPTHQKLVQWWNQKYREVKGR